jgi:hypothetical protein
MREFAARYGIPIATVHGWSARGKLPPPDEMVGNTKRWKEETLQKWIDDYNYMPKRRWEQRHANRHE